MAGRKPTPTHLKIVRGNPGKRKIDGREPRPRSGVPRCPLHLSDSARKAWARIAPELKQMGVLTLADGTAFELLVDAYAEYRAARDVVEAEGPTYDAPTQTGIIVRARPEVAIAGDAWRRVKAMMAEFGLTPSSRTKVRGEGEPKQDPFEEFLSRGARKA